MEHKLKKGTPSWSGRCSKSIRYLLNIPVFTNGPASERIPLHLNYPAPLVIIKELIVPRYSIITRSYVTSSVTSSPGNLPYCPCSNGSLYKRELLIRFRSSSHETVALVHIYHRCFCASKSSYNTPHQLKIRTTELTRSCQLPRPRPRRSKSSPSKRTNQRDLPASAAEEPPLQEQQTIVSPAKTAKPSVTDAGHTVHHASTRAKTARATRHS